MRAFLLFLILFLFSFRCLAFSDFFRLRAYGLCDLAIRRAAENEFYAPLAFFCLKKAEKSEEGFELAARVKNRDLLEILRVLNIEKEVELKLTNPAPSLDLTAFLSMDLKSLKERLRLLSEDQRKDILFFLAEGFFYSQNYKKLFELLKTFSFPRNFELRLKALSLYRMGDFLGALKCFKKLNDNFSNYWVYKISKLLGLSTLDYEKKLFESRVFDFYKLLFLWEKKKECPLQVEDFKILPYRSRSCRLAVLSQRLGLDEISLVFLRRCKRKDLNWCSVVFQLENPYYALKLAYAGSLKNCPASALYPRPFFSVVKLSSWAYRVDAPLIYAVMRQESFYDRLSVSKSNALGLMQIIPSTGRWISDKKLKEAFWEEKLFLPFYSVKYGAWYLSHLLETFPDFLAVAAYNTGPTKLSAWLKKNKWVKDISDVVEFYPVSETRLYVKKVFMNYVFYDLLFRL